MTPQERTYTEELSRLREKLDMLDALHDAPLGCECGCKEHMYLYDMMEALSQNPPCPCCRGYGCGQCQYTGWR